MDKVMQDGFGRAINEDRYWQSTGLSQTSIDEVKEYHRTHPVQADGTRLKDKDEPNSLNSKDLKGRGGFGKGLNPQGGGPDLIIV